MLRFVVISLAVPDWTLVQNAECKCSLMIVLFFMTVRTSKMAADTDTNGIEAQRRGKDFKDP